MPLEQIKQEDKLQDEFMSFWDENKDKLGLGNYSDEIKLFWLSKLDQTVKQTLEDIKVEITSSLVNSDCYESCEQIVLDIINKRLK